MSDSNEMALGYAMGQDSNGGNNGGFFGNDGIWAIIIFAMIFGWGNGGFGGFGGNGGGGALTRADLCSGFNFQNLENGVRGIQQGLCDGFYSMNTSLMSGFHGVDNAVCNLGYQTQQGFNTLGSQLASCCGDIRSGQKDIMYQMATDTCAVQNTIQNTTRDIIDNANANYRGLMDFLIGEKLSSKDAMIAQLQNQLSQSQQNGVIRAAIDASTAEILRRTGHDCPTAAYIVQPPTPVNFPTNCCGTFSGWGNGCGNSCGC